MLVTVHRMNERGRRRTRLGLTGSLVNSAGDGLLGLVEGGLRGVGSHLLRGLGVEILACCLRHIDGWFLRLVGVECRWLYGCELLMDALLTTKVLLIYTFQTGRTHPATSCHSHAFHPSMS